MVGEDKKTLTVFSTLAKNSVKFFSQNRFTRDFLLLFATSSTFAATAKQSNISAKAGISKMFFHLAKYPPFLGAPRNSIKPLCRNCRK